MSPLRRAAVATALAALVLPAAADAAKVTGGNTRIVLSAGAGFALYAAGVKVVPVGKATGGAGAGVTFPVARGHVNDALTRGVVFHRGGVAFTKGARAVRMLRPVIVVRGRQRYLAAHVGSRVIRIFLLHNLRKSAAGGATTINASLLLTPRAAKLLNRRFGTDFNAGASAGTATATLTT